MTDPMPSSRQPDLIRRLATSWRFKRIDDGHFIVPGTPYEVVLGYRDGQWLVLDDGEPIAKRGNYDAARTYVIDLLEDTGEGGPS